MPSRKPLFPPYLKKGSTIGIVCPSGYMPEEKIHTCMRVLQEEWGYKVRPGKTIGNQHHYFSGTDEERLADLQQMLDDKDIDAILFGRGGYGLSRIIDHIDFRKFRKNPKWLIGFSDITLLLSHIHSRYNIAGLHAPMANAFNDGGYKNEFVKSLQSALKGKKATYRVSGHAFSRPGKAKGQLVGGNLAMLVHAIGTPSDVDTRGKIFFLEDVGEYLYGIDRMLHQLKRSGKLEKPAALIIGGFTDCRDTTIPFGKNVEEIIHDVVKEYSYPVTFGFPVSHEKENVALKVGGTFSLEVNNKKTVLKEM